MASVATKSAPTSTDRSGPRTSGRLQAPASAPRRVMTTREFRWWDWVAFLALCGVVALAAYNLLSFWFGSGGFSQAPVVFVGLTVLLLSTIGVFASRWLSLPLMRRPRPMPARAGRRVGVATTFVPSLESIEMLERTVQAMVAMDYPHETWVLDEGDDEEVRALCARLGARHFTRKGNPCYQTESGRFASATKYGNYNAWLEQIGFDRYEIIVAFDPDHIPASDFLLRTLGYFDDPDVGYVQSAQTYYNQSASLVARGGAEETYAYYSSIQMSGFAVGYPVVTGCHNSHRATALREVGGFAPHDADDLLITFLYREAGWRGVYVPEKLATGLAPVDWSGYLRQQRRWISSLLDVKLRIFPRIAARMSPIDWLVSLTHGVHHLYGAGMALLIGLVAWMLVSGQAPAVVSGTGAVKLLLLAAALELCNIYRQRFALEPDRERGLHARAAVLRFGKWPYMLAGLYDARRPRRHEYEITPKLRTDGGKRLLWRPHLAVAALLAVALLIGLLAHSLHTPALYLLGALLIVASLLTAATDLLRTPDPYDPQLARRA
jgi:cellulose synthase (UDP-forming)